MSQLIDIEKSIRQKALEINLNQNIFGTIAEIGAGQEIARRFFIAGGASGTIAKTISAYDMAISDSIYGETKEKRYVSEERLTKMLFVEFEHLTEHPGPTLDAIYKFLEEDNFVHDFNNVEQVTEENDDMHGIPGLHTIRPKVEPILVDAKSLIGESAFNRFNDAQFWRK